MIKEKLRILLKAGVTLVFFAFIYKSGRITLAGLQGLWSAADPFFLNLSFATALLGIILGAFRWDAFLKHARIDTRPLRSLSSFLAGCTLGFITPGRVGEFGRGICHPERPAKDLALLTLVEKVYFTLFIMLYGAVAVWMSYGRMTNLVPVPPWLVMAAVIGLFLVCAFAALGVVPARFRAWMKFFPDKPVDRLYLLTLSCLVYVLMIFQFYFIMRAFAPCGLSTAFVTYAVMLMVTTLFPFSVGNLGVREACFILFLKDLEGIPEQAALSAGLLVFVQNVVIPALFGIAALFSVRKKS